VAWLDVNGFRATGVLRMELYAEGQPVRLVNGPNRQEGARAVLDLHTRGEFRLRAHKSKVARQDRSADPLVARARAATGAGAPVSPGPATPAPGAAVAPGASLGPAGPSPGQARPGQALPPLGPPSPAAPPAPGGLLRTS